jgi:molybdopterin synthase sulfur carrier subunit
MIRVLLPVHLRDLANTGAEVTLDVPEPVSVNSILTTLEQDYPVLRGTIREHSTLQRRPFLRFFANGEDVSLMPVDDVLPREIATGKEPFMIVGAIAGG